MSEKILSVFIDESGDFGPYEAHSPYYLVSMVLHNQNIDISENIHIFDSHLLNLGYKYHAIHTGPLIRRESVYCNDLTKDRKRLFNALFNFARKLDFQYSYIMVKKVENNSFTHSDIEFFDNIRDFKKNYLKHIRKKLL